VNPSIAEPNGIQIIPGMPAQAFTKTGAEFYALRPLLGSFNNALRED